MNLLLDTHLILWWQAGDARLPNQLPDLVSEADAVYISQASIWEIVIKASLGKLDLDVQQFTDNINSQGFRWLNIRNAHILAVADLPSFDDHKDPFDRLLVAQSWSEPLTLLTVDKKLERYGKTVRVL